MKYYIKSATCAESFLSETVKREYVEDLCEYHPGKYDQEGIGWLAKRYGFNLIEMLDVLDYGVESSDIICNKPGVSYQILAFEE